MRSSGSRSLAIWLDAALLTRWTISQIRWRNRLLHARRVGRFQTTPPGFPEALLFTLRLLAFWSIRFFRMSGWAGLRASATDLVIGLIVEGRVWRRV
jgi:hypothetical protein